MRLLFLCKRHYMRQDVIANRYGRLHELPRHLAGKHQVRVIMLDYHPRWLLPEARSFNDGVTNPTWVTLQLHWLLVPTLIQYVMLLRSEFRDHRPNVVVGASDSLNVVLAGQLGRIYNLPVLLDLYDNFEAFGLSRLPGLTSLYRRALERANAVTCVSQQLQDYIAQNYRPGKITVTLESTINRSDFYPMNKVDARKALGLRPDTVYIGTAGALFAGRGIKTLYAAFEEVRQTHPKIKLLLAGKIDPGAPPPQHDNVVYLGELPHTRMNTFFNSLDIAFNYMANDDFGRYSFPQKAYEMLSCGVPVLSARVGVFAGLLNDERFLYTPGDPAELVMKISALLEQPRTPDVDIPDWATQAEKLDMILNKLVITG